MTKENFSMDGFKDWIEIKSLLEFKNKSICVKPRISEKKLEEKVSVEDGDLMEIIKEFKESGGLVQDKDGKMLLIEVSCGSFFLSSQYVARF